MADLATLARVHASAEAVYMAARRDGPDWKRAWRAQNRWERRFEKWAVAVLGELQARGAPDIQSVVEEALRHRGMVFKREFPGYEEVNQRLRLRLGDENWSADGVESYVSMALDAGEDAGQFTLDALGLNKNFAWANPRAMGRDLFAVRGSKVIQQAYGSHLDKLTKMIIDAADPEDPMTVGEVAAKVRKEWPLLTRRQANLIARTETANVWETTNFNTMVANGVQNFRWLVATGPSIGTKTAPVCKVCLSIAADNPYTLEQLRPRIVQNTLVAIPPAHPNCRCTLLPVLEGWLPPAAPWAGGPLAAPIAAPAPGEPMNMPTAALTEGGEPSFDFRLFIPASAYFDKIQPLQELVRDPAQLLRVLGVPGEDEVVSLKDIVMTVESVSTTLVQQATGKPTLLYSQGLYYVLTNHEAVIAAAQQGKKEIEARVVRQ